MARVAGLHLSVQRHSAGRLRHWLLLLALGLSVCALLLVSGADYERYLASSGRPLEAYPALSLDGVKRLLVLAPHCDDEVLSAGGLIRAALEHGLDVRVVIVTAGDSYTRAARAEVRRRHLSYRDYIHLAEVRQHESLDGLMRLGLPSDHVIFLGYPEQGLAPMWWDHWEADRPFRSRYTGRERVEYERAASFGAPHCGAALLVDLRVLLRRYRPDLIVMPHPNDTHTDHRALSVFTLMAVELERAADPTLRPRLLASLVHYGLYPQPFGLSPGLPLTPPRRLEALGEWVQWRLSPEQVAAKREALAAYRSQLRVSGYYLRAFVRQNEPFMQVDEVVALGYLESQAFEDPNGVPTPPAGIPMPELGDPVSDSVLRRVAADADIAGLRAVRLGDRVWVAVQLRGRAVRAYDYRLYVRAFTPDATATWSGRYGRSISDGVQVVGHTIWFPLDLEALGQPTWLALAAETRQGVVLDQTAWVVLRLEEAPWEAQ
jgi:LmbE family N-acetylglucosaminyl deacetylase